MWYLTYMYKHQRHVTFCQQLCSVETWMILIMEMLTSAAQQLGPRQLTPVTMVTTWLEMRHVSAYTVGNGVDMHQSANVRTHSYTHSQVI